MNEKEQKMAAKKFIEFWKDKGYEKGESQTFWLSLLSKVLGVEEPEKFIEFEDQVHIDKNTGFIDAYIPSTKVLIEQKSIDKDLRKGIRQSDGSLLNPFQQAKKYIAELPVSRHPKWVITCNFKSFLIYNMENPNGEPEEILLKDLEKECYRLKFIVDSENENLKKEMEISIQAGELVGKIYDEILPLYKNPENKESLKSLNMLCVRLVFCLYAEDAGLFGKHQMFHDYLSKYEIRDLRRALIDLFRVLDTKPEERDPYINEDLAQFPYVNGGLFADEDIEIPNLNEKVKELLLTKASEDFDWSDISPTIFGAVFESTLNPETRRSGGMHYTSVENIHKVIDPLFLNELRKELDEILSLKVLKTRKERIYAFQEKISKLKFLDPACGSGNFLTETYLSLRRLENKALDALQGGQIGFGDANINPIKVSIGQFYGIEINDFAVTVAKTALWIAESQMMHETEEILHINLDFLPLKSYTNIIEGNALRIDWNDVIDKSELNYIMGNPPFVGLSLRNEEQQKDMSNVFKGNDKAGRLDYVSAWYKKASSYINNTTIHVAFVSTNSIVQGEQVPILWSDLFNKEYIHINFAYRTFVWNSEAKEKAAVHCVIIGFSQCNNKTKIIFDNDKPKIAKNINGYLVDADNVFIQLRGKPNGNIPKLVQGNKPWDGGYLILSEEEKNDLVKKYNNVEKFIKKYIGSHEFINNKVRYCLWLKDIEPNEYRNIPEIRNRLLGVADIRKNTKTVAVQVQANTPMLFSQIRQPESDYILVPETSSSNRRYIPIGFMPKDVIASNSTLVATNANLYLFGILTSNVHMSWMRTVCGRLKSDYRYSPSVYNNFPWPSPTEEQKKKIEKTAQGILDARAKYPNSSLADLYDELTMPPELRKAHQQNDIAVMEAYGFNWRNMTESDCVAELMKMYQKLIEENK